MTGDYHSHNEPKAQSEIATAANSMVFWFDVVVFADPYGYIFILMLYSIMQANLALFDLQRTIPLSFKILDTSSAATLFVTLVGALLVRHQFALGLLPRINYTSMSTTKKISQFSDVSCDIWRVEIRNTGLGSAIIDRAEYFLEPSKIKNGF